MEGKSPEFLPIEKPETTDKGFSEKRAARILEGKRMDNAQVKKALSAGRLGKPVIITPKQKILKRAARIEDSQRQKILKAHSENARIMIELINTLGQLARGSLRQEEQLMEEIRERQKIQDELLNALVLESRGQVLPKAVEDLIK